MEWLKFKFPNLTFCDQILIWRQKFSFILKCSITGLLSVNIVLMRGGVLKESKKAAAPKAAPRILYSREYAIQHQPHSAIMSIANCTRGSGEQLHIRQGVCSLAVISRLRLVPYPPTNLPTNLPTYQPTYQPHCWEKLTLTLDKGVWSMIMSVQWMHLRAKGLLSSLELCVQNILWDLQITSHNMASYFKCKVEPLHGQGKGMPMTQG